MCIRDRCGTTAWGHLQHGLLRGRRHRQPEGLIETQLGICIEGPAEAGPSIRWRGVDNLGTSLSRCLIDQRAKSHLRSSSGTSTSPSTEYSPTPTSTSASPEGRCTPCSERTAQASRPSARSSQASTCLLYTSDAADDLTRVDLGGRRI